MRTWIPIAGVLLLAACHREAALPAPAKAEAPAGLPMVQNDSADAEGVGPRAGLALEAQGVDLRLFDNDPTTGEPRKPTFWVHAEGFALTDQDIWSFEKAHAVIYGRGEASQDITLDAGEGRFQEAKMAYLKGGVVAKVGDMTLELTDIEWINEERVARTDNPVAIVNGESHLRAATMRLYPDQRQLLLTNVTGRVEWKGDGQ